MLRIIPALLLMVLVGIVIMSLAACRVVRLRQVGRGLAARQDREGEAACPVPRSTGRLVAGCPASILDWSGGVKGWLLF